MKTILGPRAAVMLMAMSFLAGCGGGGGPAGNPGLALSGSVTTFAGSPSPDGIGAGARFDTPHGIAREGGNLYVADAYNHTIRQISIATANVTTLAGTAGAGGSVDATGSAARFSNPHDVTSDGTSLYVADYGNQTIRKVAMATGEVTTLAGTAGQAGSTDATGLSAKFDRPSGIVRDGAFLYVTDYNNHTVRRVEISTGQVTTLAGTAGQQGSTDDVGAAARFRFPYGITSDGTNLYVADYGNHTVRQIVIATRAVGTLAGAAGSSAFVDGTGSSARFSGPLGIHYDGSLYVADWGNQAIRRVGIGIGGGAVTTLAGAAGPVGFVDGVGAAAKFNGPRGVVGDGTYLYVVDTFNDAIRRIDIAAAAVTTLAGPGRFTDGTGAAARFRYPAGIAADGAGYVYVADTSNHTIRKITPAGAVSTLAGLAGTSGTADGTGSAARFRYPNGVAVDGAGNVYVADTSNHTIRKISPAGSVSTLAGLAGTSGAADGTGSAANFSHPNGVGVDGAGNVYVADSDNNTIRKITPEGVVSTLAGYAGSSGSADGTGAAARFSYPSGVGVDGAGNVYVADSYNNTIRKITPAGVVSTLAGYAGSSGGADGNGAAARFSYPSAVGVDGAGNVYVADSDNDTIRKITPPGVVTTLAGLAGASGSADGTGASARFDCPSGVTTDGARLFVADSCNDSIRVIR